MCEYVHNCLFVLKWSFPRHTPRGFGFQTWVAFLRLLRCAILHPSTLWVIKGGMPSACRGRGDRKGHSEETTIDGEDTEQERWRQRGRKQNKTKQRLPLKNEQVQSVLSRKTWKMEEAVWFTVALYIRATKNWIGGYTYFVFCWSPKGWLVFNMEKLNGVVWQFRNVQHKPQHTTLNCHTH